MVEKAGHKRKLAVARAEWIEQGRTKVHVGEEGKEEDDNELDVAHGNPTTTTVTAAANATVTAAAARARTPTGDVPDDEDLYGATPTRGHGGGRDFPDEDDLDALMAESEVRDQRPVSLPRRPMPPVLEPDDDDDLDALMAEAEARDAPVTAIGAANLGFGKVGPDDEHDWDALIVETHAEEPTSGHGIEVDRKGDKVKGKDDFADDEAAMQEMGVS